MEEERFVGSTLMSEDSDWDVSLRPTNLGEYVGQEKIKENLKVFIEASKKRNQALDHVLLYGPPGLGKTTLSYIISNELGSNIRITSGPAIERAADLAAILTNLSENDVLFIDEIHRLNRAVEEILYPAMEDFALDIIIGKGPSARSMRINLPQFTLIGATTRAGMLTGPLRDRFGVICRLELYTSNELASIIGRSAKILEIGITKEAELEIAKRSRGTPRIANRLLKRVRDFAEVKNKGIIDIEVARYALEKLEIDELGLDFNDINLLKIMISRFGGGPVGAETLASALNEETVTIEDVIEPYLLQTGFIARTPRGRICLPFAYRHLGLKMPVEKEKQLGFFDSGQMVNTPQLAAESAADDGSRACSGVDIDHFDNGECDG